MVICLFFSGCAYNKSTYVTLSGKGIKVPLKGIGTIEGEEATCTINRVVSVTSPIKKTTLKSKIADKEDTLAIQ